MVALEPAPHLGELRVLLEQLRQGCRQCTAAQLRLAHGASYQMPAAVANQSAEKGMEPLALGTAVLQHLLVSPAVPAQNWLVEEATIDALCPSASGLRSAGPGPVLALLS